MTALVDRLRAAIEERGALAEAATPGPWANTGQAGDGDAWQIHGAPTGETRFEYDNDLNDMVEVPVRHEVATLNYSDGGGVWRKEDADHIVANQPSTVIARCKADLRILDRYEDAQGIADRNEANRYEHNYAADTAAVLHEVVEHLAESYGITEEET